MRHTGDNIPLGTTRLTSLPRHITRLDTHAHGALVSCLTNGGKRYTVVQNTSVTEPLSMDVATDGQLQLVLADGTRQPAALYGPLFILTPGNIVVFEETAGGK